MNRWDYLIRIKSIELLETHDKEESRKICKENIQEYKDKASESGFTLLFCLDMARVKLSRKFKNNKELQKQLYSYNEQMLFWLGVLNLINKSK
jgi:hypothetical protein